MSPPTEQLIRDYLNRLSVAARGQLGPDDRRALVNRTRDFIERKTGLAGPPTAMETARLLAGLGDPSRLVQQERQRLAAVRGDVPGPAAGRSRIARVLRRDSGKARSPSWHWPVLAGSRADLQLTLLDGGETQTDAQDPAAPASPSAGASVGSNGTARNGPAPAGPAPTGTAGDDVPAGADDSALDVPAQANEPSWFMLTLGGRELDPLVQPAEPLADSAEAPQAPAPAGPVSAKPQWPSVVAGSDADAGTRLLAESGWTVPGDCEPAGPTPAGQLTTPWDPVISRRASRAVSAVVAWSRRNPLEASAIVLLGLGGVIYPPVWVLGAIVALTSRMWDYRDKWVGLALPLLLALIGIALGVTYGGHVSVGEGVHEGWVYGVVTSRIAAALSAGYLGWRSVHGRRPPAVPPWNRPHKIG
jgi:hypothetical protein